MPEAKQGRALKRNRPDPKEPANLKAALPHASSRPKENSLDPKEVPGAKRKRAHITTKKQESPRPAVPRSDLRENNILFRVVVRVL